MEVLCSNVSQVLSSISDADRDPSSPSAVRTATAALLMDNSSASTSIEGAGSRDSIGLEMSITTVIQSLLLSLLILVTVIGNVFVITAIVIERNLRTFGNYLVFSLAIADLTVACLVMPISAINEVTGRWIFGPVLCDFWTCVDVLSCTASILHLVAIALDRYWAVTNVHYITSRTSRSIGTLIAGVWAIAAIVSAAPILGWKDADFHRRITEEKQCIISQDMVYQILATCTTFYAPLIVILILYWKIYKVARKRIRRKPGDQHVTRNVKPSCAVPETKRSDVSDNDGKNSEELEVVSAPPITPAMKAANDLRKEKERKAAKTLAIITGVFIVCWSPFFALTLLVALRVVPPDVSPLITSLFLWLGYLNSSLNPIIYTIFSPDFRNSFKKMLPCRRRRVQNSRPPGVKSMVRAAAVASTAQVTASTSERVQLSTMPTDAASKF